MKSRIMSFSLFSYVDPGTGAIVLQILAGVVVAIAVFFRNVVLYPFRFFLSKRENDDSFFSNDGDVEDEEGGDLDGSRTNAES